MDLKENALQPWIWHPNWTEPKAGSAGGFVYFRKSIDLPRIPDHPVEINITADTRYNLYINNKLVHFGPVKGDEARWFYDTVDIQPFLRCGHNSVAVHVLRFFHATQFAPAFARSPYGGLYVRAVDQASSISLNSNETWETAIDLSTSLPVNSSFDGFLHVFETKDRRSNATLQWTQAVQHSFIEGWGITAPWKLCPRLIPFQRREPVLFSNVHNTTSHVDERAWAELLTGSTADSLRLLAGTSHHVELEVATHLTALLAFRFATPESGGSTLRVTYSECFEDEPEVIPHLRRKGNRKDNTKKIIGPSDIFIFGGGTVPPAEYDERDEESFQPFHFRTFRCMALDIQVHAGCDLILKGIDIVKTTYPLDVRGSFQTNESWTTDLWDISVRTLQNCMHDGYEDCPFYEQLQYGMDTRSSALFTYLSSGDDRMARQAIIQFHDSFQVNVGLTSARTPCSSIQRQLIPAFSLYWVCMVADHHEYFNDASFTQQFLPVCHATLDTFERRRDHALGLVKDYGSSTFWSFTDWTKPWAPEGIPPAVTRTGYSTYVNCLYIYTLNILSRVAQHLHMIERAAEYKRRAQEVTAAVLSQCFDGEYFTDGLFAQVDASTDYSQHTQVWAVLSGVILGDRAGDLLTKCLAHGDLSSQSSAITQNASSTARRSGDVPFFTATSISFSFYTIRALSVAGKEVYNQHFHGFWSLWKGLVAENLTTWPEDAVSVRSDCHAWGSIPIFEFTTEVAGVRPASPGWRAIWFEPRVQLFPSLKAEVPITVPGGVGKAYVEWKPVGNDGSFNEVIIKLDIRDNMGLPVVEVPVTLVLPGRLQETIRYSAALNLRVQATVG